MPEDPHYMKQGDTASIMKRTLVNAFGSPVNLTGASLKFSMRVKPAGTVKVNGALATIANAGLGEVQYSFSTDDTDTADEFESEWEVSFSDGSVQTFPNDGYTPVIVTDDIA